MKVSDVWTCVSDLTIISLRSKCQLFTLTKFPMACALESRSSRQLAVRSLFLLRSVEPCSSWELDLKKSGKLKASFPPFLRPMPNIYPLASRNKKPTTRAKSSSVYFKRLRFIHLRMSYNLKKIQKLKRITANIASTQISWCCFKT